MSLHVGRPNKHNHVICGAGANCKICINIYIYTHRISNLMRCFFGMTVSVRDRDFLIYPGIEYTVAIVFCCCNDAYGAILTYELKS